MNAQTSDDILIIPEAEGNPTSSSQSSVTQQTAGSNSQGSLPELINWGDYIKAFAQIGTQLAETFSENNQETAQGFVQSLEKIEDMLQQLLTKENVALSIPERDGLIELLKYLRKKLQRRAGAVSQNDLNM